MNECTRRFLFLATCQTMAPWHNPFHLHRLRSFWIVGKSILDSLVSIFLITPAAAAYSFYTLLFPFVVLGNHTSNHSRENDCYLAIYTSYPISWSRAAMTTVLLQLSQHRPSVTGSALCPWVQKTSLVTGCRWGSMNPEHMLHFTSSILITLSMLLSP